MEEKYGFFRALKDLFKYSKENKNKYILGTIFMIIFVITSMIYTTMNSKLIANIMSLNLDKAIKLVFICALLRIFSITFCHNQYRKIVIKTGEEISATIQKKIYSKVLNLSMTSFENMKSGKIFTTIKAADSGMMSTISELFQESAYVATSVVMLFVIYFIDWKIGLGVTAISAISLLLFKIKLNKSKKYLKSEFNYADNYSTLVNETTRGFKEIKALDLKEKCFNIFEKDIENLKDTRIVIIGENTHHWYLSYMTMLCGAAIAVPVDKELPENEIAYLTSIFALFIEQEKDKKKKYNILVICATNMSTSKLLAYQYKKKFKKYIDEVYTCEMYNLDSFDFSKVDYIFTTVEINRVLPKPVLGISAFLEDEEVEKISSILKFKSSNTIADVYSEELFYDNIKGETKEEILFEICKRIPEKYGIPSDFYEGLLRREEITGTDLAKHVALPHPYETTSDISFACISVLDHPIRWTRQDVQVVILMAVAEDEQRDLTNFLQLISEFIANESAVLQLVEEPDFTTFVNLLSQIEM